MRSPGRILASVGQRLRDAPGAIAAGLGAVGGALGRAGHRLGEDWRSLSVFARRRIFAVGLLAVVIVLFFAALVPNLPCQFPGGDYCAPDDEAAGLVPAETLAYVHADVDADTREYDAAAEIADRIPLFSEQLLERSLRLLPGPPIGSAAFEDQVRPWLGGEVALAVLVGPTGAPAPVALMAVDDPDAAADYASGLTTAPEGTGQYRGVNVTEGGKGIATAQTDGFLIVGEVDAVRDVIDVSEGQGDSVESSSEIDALRDELPEHRVADLYLSPDGIRRLVARSDTVLATAAPLLEPRASEGAAAALEATDDGLELTLRSDLDPDRAADRPGFFAAFPAFDPELPERLDPGTLAYLGIGAPSEAVNALLGQAARTAPAIAEGFDDLIKKLGAADQAETERQLLDALGDEAAFALVPGPSPEDQTPGAAQVTLPLLEFVAGGVDEEQAKGAFASLQEPVAAALGSAEGTKTPGFSESDVGGVAAQSLLVSPAVDLTYAIFDDLAAVATGPAAIEELASGDGGLDVTDLYEKAVGDIDDDVSTLVFADLANVISVGEQLGAAENPVYATFAGDFRRLKAVGIAIRAGKDSLDTDARLLVSDAEPSADSTAATPSD